MTGKLPRNLSLTLSEQRERNVRRTVVQTMVAELLVSSVCLGFPRLFLSSLLSPREVKGWSIQICTLPLQAFSDPTSSVIQEHEMVPEDRILRAETGLSR